jgi:hypothetical protein
MLSGDCALELLTKRRTRRPQLCDNVARLAANAIAFAASVLRRARLYICCDLHGA